VVHPYSDKKSVMLLWYLYEMTTGNKDMKDNQKRP